MTNLENAIKKLTDMFNTPATPGGSSIPTSHQQLSSRPMHTPPIAHHQSQEIASSSRCVVSPTDTPNSQVDDLSVFYQIRDHIIDESLDQCRSRRNLAGRLCNQVFTIDEKKTSNFRGVKDKKCLDKKKTAAIRRVCLKHFPPNPHEPIKMVERDIREGIDEMCRRCARKDRNFIGQNLFN